MKLIKQPLYSKIHQLLPIACIDLVIFHKSKILLIKRDVEPAKNQYWFPGGRIMRGESFVEAANRIAKSEVGLTISKLTNIGIGNLLFKEDPFGHGLGTHTVSFIYKCQTSNNAPSLDNNHIDYIWWNGKSGKYHPYVKAFAIKAKL